MEGENKIPVPPRGVEVENKIVRTYAEDMAEAISSDAGGLLKKIIHEEEDREASKKNLSPESKKNKLFMFISLILVFLALAILAYFFLVKKEINTVPVAEQFTPLIFNDQSTFMEVSGLKKDEIIQTIVNEVNNTKTKINGIKGIYLTENKKVVGLRRFLSLIQSNLTVSSNPLFVSDNFLLGGFNGKTKSFFMLVKVRTGTDIFDSMRAWERKMLTNLHGLVGVDLSSETNYLFTKDFEDGVIKNKNARILRDKDGNLVLGYVFVDDTSVVITNSEEATGEIMLRLASGEQKK